MYFFKIHQPQGIFRSKNTSKLVYFSIGEKKQPWGIFGSFQGYFWRWEMVLIRHCSLFIACLSLSYPFSEGATSFLCLIPLLSLSLLLSFCFFDPYHTPYPDIVIATQKNAKKKNRILVRWCLLHNFQVSHLSFGHLPAVHSLYFGRLGIQFILSRAEQHQRLQRTQQVAWMLKMVGNPWNGRRVSWPKI